MARLEVTVKLNVPDISVQPKPAASWSLGPGDPGLMELLGRRLGINGATVEMRDGWGYLVWDTPRLPQEKELQALYRKICKAVTEIDREIEEFRLLLAATKR